MIEDNEELPMSTPNQTTRPMIAPNTAHVEVIPSHEQLDQIEVDHVQAVPSAASSSLPTSSTGSSSSMTRPLPQSMPIEDLPADSDTEVITIPPNQGSSGSSTNRSSAHDYPPMDNATRATLQAIESILRGGSIDSAVDLAVHTVHGDIDPMTEEKVSEAKDTNMTTTNTFTNTNTTIDPTDTTMNSNHAVDEDSPTQKRGRDSDPVLVYTSNGQGQGDISSSSIGASDGTEGLADTTFVSNHSGLHEGHGHGDGGDGDDDDQSQLDDALDTSASDVHLVNTTVLSHTSSGMVSPRNGEETYAVPSAGEEPSTVDEGTQTEAFNEEAMGSLLPQQQGEDTVGEEEEEEEEDKDGDDAEDVSPSNNNNNNPPPPPPPAGSSSSSSSSSSSLSGPSSSQPSTSSSSTQTTTSGNATTDTNPTDSQNTNNTNTNTTTDASLMSSPSKRPRPSFEPTLPKTVEGTPMSLAQMRRSSCPVMEFEVVGEQPMEKKEHQLLVHFVSTPTPKVDPKPSRLRVPVILVHDSYTNDANDNQTQTVAPMTDVPTIIPTDLADLGEGRPSPPTLPSSSSSSSRPAGVVASPSPRSGGGRGSRSRPPRAADDSVATPSTVNRFLPVSRSYGSTDDSFLSAMQSLPPHHPHHPHVQSVTRGEKEIETESQDMEPVDAPTMAREMQQSRNGFRKEGEGSGEGIDDEDEDEDDYEEDDIKEEVTQAVLHALSGKGKGPAEEQFKEQLARMAEAMKAQAALEEEEEDEDEDEDEPIEKVEGSTVADKEAEMKQGAMSSFSSLGDVYHTMPAAQSSRSLPAAPLPNVQVDGLPPGPRNLHIDHDSSSFVSPFPGRSTSSPIPHSTTASRTGSRASHMSRISRAPSRPSPSAADYPLSLPHTVTHRFLTPRRGASGNGTGEPSTPAHSVTGSSRRTHSTGLSRASHSDLSAIASSPAVVRSLVDSFANGGSTPDVQPSSVPPTPLTRTDTNNTSFSSHSHNRVGSAGIPSFISSSSSSSSDRLSSTAPLAPLQLSSLVISLPGSPAHGATTEESLTSNASLRTNTTDDGNLETGSQRADSLLSVSSIGRPAGGSRMSRISGMTRSSAHGTPADSVRASERKVDHRTPGGTPLVTASSSGTGSAVKGRGSVSHHPSRSAARTNMIAERALVNAGMRRHTALVASESRLLAKSPAKPITPLGSDTEGSLVNHNHNHHSHA